jgi:hypothetical protein
MGFLKSDLLVIFLKTANICFDLRYFEYILKSVVDLCTVDPRVTTGLTYEQLGLRPKF